MAILVSEGTGNFSTQTWYRGEASQLNFAGSQQGLGTARYSVTTFSNAGSLRGIIPPIYSTTSVLPVARYFYVAAHRGQTVTTPVASPGIVTQTGHGFVANATCTLTIASPCVVTQVAHGLCDGDQVGFTTTGALPTGLTNTGVYYAKNVTADTFEVATARGGASVTTTGTQSGTHTLWKQTVQFTTTGALPTGITANTVYYVNYIDANTYYIKTTPAAANSNFTGSTSGTHTAWTPIDYAYRYMDDLFGTGTTYGLAFTALTPFLFQKNASVTTTANGYRFMLVQGDGSGSNVNCYTTNADNASFVFLAWCNNTVSYTTSDAPVFTQPITIDQDVTFKGSQSIVGYTATALIVGFAGMICTPAAGNRAYSSSGAGNAMLKIDASASRTITVDGAVIVGSHAGLYFGTEDVPITYANKLTINYQVPPSFTSSTASVSSWADITLASIGPGGGVTMVKSGAYPTQRYATLTSDAATGQKDLVVDDASGFAVNDYVYITKSEVTAPTGNISTNATRYQIASIAGNTITLTANVTGEKRLTGGRVVLMERGYGVQEYSTSLTGPAAGMRFSYFTNFYMKGVYQRGLQPITNVGLNRFFDNSSNLRQQYAGYSLSENYQSAQSAGASYFFSGIYPETLGFLIENCIGIGNTIANGFSRVTTSPAAGVIQKTGDIEIKNCIVHRTSNMSINGLPSANSAYVYVHDCEMTNVRDGLGVGGTNSKYVNNTMYGGTYGTNFGNSFFCSMRNNTFENIGYLYNLFTSGTVILGTTNDAPVITGTTPSSYTMAFNADVYYDLSTWNSTADLITTLDYTNQAFISPSSEIRFVRNADTSGSNLIITSTGTSSTYTTALENFPVMTLRTPATYTSAFNDTTLDFTTAGTYDLRTGAHLGTLTLSNSSGGSVTVKLAPGISYVNSGPNITVEVSKDTTIELTGLVSGSRVYVNNTTDNISLYNAVVAATTLSIPITWTADKTLDIRVAYSSGTTAYLPFQQGATLTSNGANILVSQELDTVYNTNAIDGSLVTEFAPDYPNIQIDITAGSSTSPQRLYAAFSYILTSSQGIITFFGGMTAQDLLNYTINVSVVDLKLDNTGSTPVLFTGGYLYRDDGTTVIYSGSGSIQLDPKRAYDSKETAILSAVYGLY